MNDCSTHRQELGALVLGGLEPEEVAALRQHLEGCSACRAEHEQLATTVPLLALVPSAPPRAPDRVRDRVVSAAARRRLTRRWTASAAAAVLLAALLGGVAGWRLAPGPPLAVTVPLEAVEPFAASGSVTFREVDGRVLVEVELEDLDPLEGPSVYEAWLYEADRRIVSIGQLSSDRAGASAAFHAEGELSDYRGFWITAEPDRRDPAHDGPTVVRAPVPQTR